MLCNRRQSFFTYHKASTSDVWMLHDFAWVVQQRFVCTTFWQTYSRCAVQAHTSSITKSAACYSVLPDEISKLLMYAPFIWSMNLIAPKAVRISSNEGYAKKDCNHLFISRFRFVAACLLVNTMLIFGRGKRSKMDKGKRNVI